MEKRKTVISIEKTADILEISTATVQNWIKQGYLSPAGEAKNRFHASDVDSLKNRIERGDIRRLRKRANKSQRKTTQIPEEYLKDRSFINEINAVKNCVEENNLPLELSLFILALKVLVVTDELSPPIHPFSNLEFQSKWKRHSVREEILKWFRRMNLNRIEVPESCFTLFDLLENTQHRDTLGILYQSLLSEGRKSSTGSYYTPEDLILDTFTTFKKRDGIFLDPCCGTGQFLLCSACEGYTDPRLLYGFDTDRLAVKIARINLLLAFDRQEFNPNIYCTDILSEPAETDNLPVVKNLQKNCRIIATNPPWGASLEKKTLSDCRKHFPVIKSRESFSFILAKSIQFAETGGGISFVLPESFMNIRSHADIRIHVLENTTIKSIHAAGKSFKNVFTPVIKLNLINRKPARSWRIETRKNLHQEQALSIPQKRFLQNSYCIFDIHVTNKENEIIKKPCEMAHVTLENNADWALGIVTGNNRKHLSEIKQNGMEPVYKGNDIQPFIMREPRFFIKFNPDSFQQVASEALYRAPEKLIYRFISERLIFAYDCTRSLTLNSANILIPRVPGYSTKILSALFNSKLFQFIYSKKFSTRKVLRGDLEKLPLPVLSNEQKKELESLAEKAVSEPVDKITDTIDTVIMQYCGLSTSQITYVSNWFAATFKKRM